MSSRAWLRIAVSSALVLLFSAPPLSGQQPATIPVELASALLSFRAPGYGGPVEFLVGEAPAELDVEWPEGSRIVGAALWRARWTVVATVEGPTAESIRSLHEDLLERGWREPVERPRSGGFQLNRPDRGVGVLCGAEGELRTVFGVARPGGGSLLLLHAYDGDEERDGRTPCDPPPEPQVWPRPPDVLPPIDPPPGARLRVLGGSGSPTSDSSVAVIETELDVEALFEHLAGQLEEAGWGRGTSSREAGSPDAAGDAKVALWTLEEDGEVWRGELVVGRVPGTDDYEARLKAWKPGERG